MRQILLILLIMLLCRTFLAQTADTTKTFYQNTADRLLSSDNKLILGGYGEVHYNQPIRSGTKDNGVLDVHRMVMLLGYNFSAKTQFITEIEYEHVSEVYIEQAFLQYKFRDYLNFRAGLMLIPMGIVNEYHEPTAFNGVERTAIDTRISPTTWREIGIGITGNLLAASIKYQFYLVNGFNGYDGEARLNGNNGFRSGRQRGADSYISAPNVSGKIEYYGIMGLNVGLSGYFGQTQSRLYSGIDKDDKAALARADSSVTGIAMAGLDARYQAGGLQMRGQAYLVSVSNTDQYNVFTAKEGVLNDLGRVMYGYYLEAGYDVLKLKPGMEKELILFARYENYNTHFATMNGLAKNKAYANHMITTGLSLKLARGAVVKTDFQLSKSAAATSYAKGFNAGFGVMF